MSTTFKKDEGNKAKDQASQAVDKTRDAASHASEAASHAAAAVGQKASEVGQAVSQKASEVGQAVGHKAEEATSAVGSGMQTLADKVRDNTPNEGMLGSASKAVADTIDSAGKYVEDKNLTGMMDDVTGLIRRNPVPALLVGLGIGFLIGRALSSRS
jgi:ElaB/YqjD/DUF883 family membrane-anchored ribosome-binding protein